MLAELQLAEPQLAAKQVASKPTEKRLLCDTFDDVGVATANHCREAGAQPISCCTSEANETRSARRLDPSIGHTAVNAVDEYTGLG